MTVPLHKGGLSLASWSPPPRPLTFTMRSQELHLNCTPSCSARLGYDLFPLRLQSYLRLEIGRSFPWDGGEYISSLTDRQECI